MRFTTAILLLVLIVTSCQKEKASLFIDEIKKNQYQELIERYSNQKDPFKIKKGDFIRSTENKIDNIGGIRLRHKINKNDSNVYYLLPNRSIIFLTIYNPSGCIRDSFLDIYYQDSCEQVDSIIVIQNEKWFRYYHAVSKNFKKVAFDSLTIDSNCSSIDTMLDIVSVGDDFIDVMQKLIHFKAVEFRGSSIRAATQSKYKGSFLDLRWFILPDNTCLKMDGLYSPEKDSNKIILSHLSIGKKGKGYEGKCSIIKYIRLRQLNICDYLGNKENAIIVDSTHEN